MSGTVEAGKGAARANAATNARVASLEPSSLTTISSGGRVCARTLSRKAWSHRSPL